MAVSENFLGKNYWGLVQQNGPWKMTGRDYANQINHPETPGPAGTKRFQGDQTVSFKDRHGIHPTSMEAPSRYAQFSIVSGRGRSIVPAPAPYGGDGKGINIATGFNSNPVPGDINYQDPASVLNIQGNMFGMSLNNEYAQKPLYPKVGTFISQDYLMEQAVKQQLAPTIQYNQAQQQALGDQYYDSVLGGVAPPVGHVSTAEKRDGNVFYSLMEGPYESIFTESFIPPREDLITQNLQIHSSLQARQDDLVDYYNGVLAGEAGRQEQSLDPSRRVFN
jgi:hypothetical protein